MPDSVETVSDILDERHKIGGNQPPLAELLVEETATLKKRADDLVASAGRCAVTDDDTAGKAVALGKMIAEWAVAVEKARKDRKEPFLVAGRAIDAHFGTLLAPLEIAKKAVVRALDTYRRDLEARAAAERRRRDAEAAELQRQADESARAASLTGKVEDEIEAQQAATKAQEVAAVEVPKPVIDSGVGAKAFSRKVAVVTLTDLSAACAYLIETQESQVREFIQARYAALARSGARKLPGATVTEDSATSIR